MSDIGNRCVHCGEDTSDKKITKEAMMLWAETYDEAIQALLWFANDGYKKDEMIESILDMKSILDREEVHDHE